MAAGSFHVPRPQTPELVQRLFLEQRQRDPLGSRVHLILAVIGCFLGMWFTSAAEWAMLPVLVCFLVRMTGQHRILEPLAFDRVVRVLVLWTAWVGISVLWSAGRENGSRDWLMDVQSLRFVAVPIVLWPVVDRRAWLIGAMVAGLACGQLMQMVHGIGVAFNLAWVPFHRMPGRITGWWDPAVAGSILCAALGLWLGALAFARTKRSHLCGAAGALITLICIGISGTRGAWIGAALLIAITAWFMVRRTRYRRMAAVAVAASLVLGGCLAAGIATYVLSVRDAQSLPPIAQRLRVGIEEVRGAEDPGGYASDTGLRIAMWRWGWAAFRTHPLFGVGAGGYRAWVQGRTVEDAARLGAPAGAIPHLHAHAHSWYLHTLATLGAVGGVLLLSTLVGAIRSGMRDTAAGMWSVGPPLALLGLACAGLFDDITVNQQTMLIFCTLVGLCLPSRPVMADRASGAEP